MRVFKGNPVSKGIEIGKVYKYIPYHAEISKELVEKDQTEKELEKYKEAKQAAYDELKSIQEKMGEEDQDKAAIIGAHIEILNDPAMDEQIVSLIKDEKNNLKLAVDSAYTMFIGILEKVQDDLIRERIADMKDVRNRILRCADHEEEKNLSTLPEKVIIIAKDLFPSDTASLDRNKVLGIVTEVGGATSHTAIIARSYEIPAILGLKDALNSFEDGEEIIVDAMTGNVYADADSETRDNYIKKAEIVKRQKEDMKKYISVVPVTKDGKRIYVNLNIGSANEDELSHAAVADGVGLFRSEFLYMGREKLPDEEEQYEIYTRVLKAFEGKDVILRTMDIGGDKKLDCMELPKEDNPFLGKRALRLSFSYPDIFVTQLKAALRAAVNGKLWIMFPMVESLDDVRRAKQYVEQARKELEEANIPYGEVKIGVMIEIPAVAVIADQIVKEVDFASIGTNDLTQYTLAVDRMNPDLSDFYQKYHPAVLRLIRNVIEQFNKAGKHVGVCGELGGDEVGSLLLVGFGLEQLSMGYASVAQIKKIVTSVSEEEAKEIADKACNMGTSKEIEAYVTEILKEKDLIY